MYQSSVFFMTPGLKPLFFLLAILDIFLRGITLYKSARRDQKPWFIALLLINSLGILPIIYLVVNKDVQLMRTSSAVSTPKKKVAKKSKR